MPFRRMMLVLTVAAGFGSLLSALTRIDAYPLQVASPLCDSGGSRPCP